MKKALKLTLAVALMMGATSLYAQKFGRINSQEIVMAMPETKEMQTNLETFGKELNENIETINVEFNNKLQEYQKTANTLTDAVREMKAKELEDLQRRSQEFQQMAQRATMRRSRRNCSSRLSRKPRLPSTRSPLRAAISSCSTPRPVRWPISTRPR